MKPRAALLLTLFVAGCRPPATSTTRVSAEPGPATPAPPAANVGLEPVEATVDPCVDFYQHACVRWLAEHPRPLASPVWMRSFSVAEAQAQARVRVLLDEFAAAKEGLPAKLGAYWRACIDEDGRITAGYAAIEPLLRAIDEARPRDLGAVLGKLHAHGVPALFQARTVQGATESAPIITLLGSTGLATVEMYAPTAPRLTAYGQHVAEMLRLAGLPDAPRRAAAVIAFEARLAALHPTAAELVAEQSKPSPARPVATLRQQAPSIDWDRYFAAQDRQVPAQIVASPRMRDLDALLGRTNIQVLRDYLRWQLLHALATILPPVFEIEHNRMYNPAAAVAGRTESCVRHVGEGFGPTLGRTYVERHVTAGDHARLSALATKLRAALRAEVERAAWIDPAARAAAVAHIDALAITIAEPDPRPDPLASLPATTDFLATSLALRVARLSARETTPSLDVTGVGAAMWGDRLEVSAGLIQPPIYSGDMPDPVLLGTIGQLLAHELGHTLDPETLGSFVPAWRPTPATAAAYATRLQCVSDSYARREVAPGIHVHGGLVAKEMFSDNLGLRLVHPLVPADSPGAQRQFFTAWAQLQCTHFMPDMLALMAQTDAAPAPLRVNQALALFPPFAAAFACKEDTPMRPRDACAPW